ncbi:FG-GAP-like repeat-containing protein [Pyxidicoccus sp. 3LFB2]
MHSRGWVAVVAAGFFTLSWGCGAGGAGEDANIPGVVSGEESATPGTTPPPVKEEEVPPDAAEEQPSSARPPGPPTGLTVRPGVGTVEVSWEPPAEDGGAAVTGYTVRVFTQLSAVDAYSHGEPQTFSSSARKARVSVPGTHPVRVQLTARNVAGESAPVDSTVLSSIETIGIGATAEPLPGGGHALVEITFSRWHSTPARLVLEYQDPRTGGFLPASLVEADSRTLELFAAPHPRPVQLIWAHYRDLPEGPRAPYDLYGKLRARALVDGVELGSQTFHVDLRPGDPFVEAPLEQRTGASPSAVRVGDFNGDGQADLAVANQQTANIAVFFQTDAGLPEHSVRFTPVPAAAELLVTGDFNDDGALDLATGGRSAPSAFVLLGTGDGHFTPGPDVPMGGALHALAQADVNEDGNGDLVALSAEEGRFQVALGRGDGSFNPALRFEAPPDAQWLDVADFDGDGHVDLAFASQGMAPGVSFAAGQGDGTFRLAARYACPILDAVGTGDVEADGVAEVLVVCRNARDASGMAPILSLSPDGSQRLLARQLGLTPESRGARLYMADVTGDGRQDLLLASSGSEAFGTGSLGVMTSRDDGSFHLAQQVLVHSPLALALGDLNGDRHVDVAIAGGQSNFSIARVELLFGTRAGTLQPPSPRNLNRRIQDALPVDLDADGRMDLVVAQDVVSLRRGRGDGSFHPAHELFLRAPPRALAAANFTNDSRPELLVADMDGDIRYYVFSGRVLEQGPLVGQVPFAEGLATADFNGDAVPDVLVSRSGGVGPVLLLSSPLGYRQFDPPLGDGRDWHSAIAADADGDGHVDLVVGGPWRPLLVLRGDGRGGFSRAPFDLPVGNVAHVADLTGDGRPDLLTQGCELLAGQAEGAFVALPQGRDVECNRASVGDFDGDGRLDVLSSAIPESGQVSLWRVDPTGTFHALGALGRSSTAREVRAWAADFNGDGIDDPIVYRHYLYESIVSNELTLSLSGPCTACTR